MSTGDRVSRRSIARDQLDYLRENPGVCAEGNVSGPRWIRFQDGEWLGLRYSSQDHRLRSYLRGYALSRDMVLDWMERKPVTLVPAREAGNGLHTDQSVWADAADQGVFTGLDRCGWCGLSEEECDLTLYETVEDGETLLCPSCTDSWKEAGEIVEVVGTHPC